MESKGLLLGKFRAEQPCRGDMVLQFQDFRGLYESDLARQINATNITFWHCKKLEDIQYFNLNSHVSSASQVIFAKLAVQGCYAIYYMNVQGQAISECIAPFENLESIFDEMSISDTAVLVWEHSAKSKGLLWSFVEHCPSFHLGMLQIQEQLSPNGMALLSYINHQNKLYWNQPFVALSMEEILNALLIFNNAETGHKISIIFQEIDRDFHKTSLLFKKYDNYLAVYYLDSSNQESGYIYPRVKIIHQFLTDNKIASKHYIALNPNNDSKNLRQYDLYQCGTLALKDARKLLHEFNDFDAREELYFELTWKYPKDTYGYPLPAFSFKSIQSSKVRQQYLTQDPQKLVSIKLEKNIENLYSFYKKYPNSQQYLKKFSEKYRTQINEYIAKVPTEEILEGIKTFTLNQLTLETIKVLNKLDDPSTARFHELYHKAFILQDEEMQQAALQFDEKCQSLFKQCQEYITNVNLQGLKEVLFDVPELRVMQDRTNHQISLLHWAVIEDRPKIVRYLCESGAQVNLQETYRWTALHQAAYSGHTECFLNLLKFKADLSIYNSSQETPLDLAITRNHWDMIKAIKDYYDNHAAHYGGKWLHYLISNTRHTKALEILLKQNLIDNLDESTGLEHEWRPVHVAVHNNNKGAFNLLLNYKADINGQEKYGWTPLHQAAYENKQDWYNELLSRGADEGIENSAGMVARAYL